MSRREPGVEVTGGKKPRTAAIENHPSTTPRYLQSRLTSWSCTVLDICRDPTRSQKKRGHQTCSAGATIHRVRGGAFTPLPSRARWESIWLGLLSRHLPIVPVWVEWKGVAKAKDPSPAPELLHANRCSRESQRPHTKPDVEMIPAAPMRVDAAAQDGHEGVHNWERGIYISNVCLSRDPRDIFANAQIFDRSREREPRVATSVPTCRTQTTMTTEEPESLR